MPVNLVLELKKWGDISYAVPLRLKSVGGTINVVNIKELMITLYTWRLRRWHSFLENLAGVERGRIEKIGFL